MNRNFDKRLISAGALAAALLLAAASARLDSGNLGHAAGIAPLPAATPSYTGYKGVKIGMTDEDARKLLGVPKEKSDGQDYFVYSENEAAQVVYDGGHKVVTVSVTYLGKSSSIPTPKVIFGEDAEAKPDGSITKIVRYTKDGFSISYNRTGGDDPLVMVTVQKIYGPAN
jgi:hypothetical protein